MPKISVIVPVYNVEEYLHRCIDSVLNQTFTNIELILVDDGSTDNSGKICDEYQMIDDRVIVIHQENAGAAVARNTGIDKSTGEFIAFVDSDDFIHPQMYEILYDVINKTNSDVSACHYRFAKPQEIIEFEKYDYSIYENINTCICDDILKSFDKHYRRVSLIQPCMRLCRSNVFDNLRFKAGMIEEDSVLLLPLLEKSNKISKVDLPLYFWTENPQSVTRCKFSPKRFAFVDVSLFRFNFFKNRRDKRLSSFFCNEYMNRCVAFYIKAVETGYTTEFSKYLKIYRKNFLHYFHSCNFCKMEKLMHILFYFRLPFYKKIYSRILPVDSVLLR